MLTESGCSFSETGRFMRTKFLPRLCVCVTDMLIETTRCQTLRPIAFAITNRHTSCRIASANAHVHAFGTISAASRLYRSPITGTIGDAKLHGLGIGEGNWAVEENDRPRGCKGPSV